MSGRTDFRAEIREALGHWVDSLNSDERTARCMMIARAVYSPAEIREAVENETEMGLKFIEGLLALQARISKQGSKLSVIDLIRNSVNSVRIESAEKAQRGAGA
ncbi:MAG: hypothetical protein DMG37_22860 [Acidobacteria bacterium]|nr:MAG: hypothetical protein DMG37_22860 [Acidobacteriota bacterium]